VVVFEHSICSCPRHSPQRKGRQPLRQKWFGHHTRHCAFCCTILQALLRCLCFPRPHFRMLPGEPSPSQTKWLVQRSFLLKNAGVFLPLLDQKILTRPLASPSPVQAKAVWISGSRKHLLSSPLVPPTLNSFWCRQGAGLIIWLWQISAQCSGLKGKKKPQIRSPKPGAPARLQVQDGEAWRHTLLWILASFNKN